MSNFYNSQQPNQGYPNQGYPNQGYSNQGYSNQGYPPQQSYSPGSNAPPVYHSGYESTHAPLINPKYTTAGSPLPSKIVETRRWNDLWAALLFILCLAAFAYAAYLGVPKTLASFQPGQVTSARGFTLALTASQIAYPIAILLAVSVVLTFLWFILIQAFPRQMIKISYWASCLMLVATGVYVIILGGTTNIVIGVVILLVAALYAWSYVVIRYKIPFASIMLETTTSISRQFPATILAGFIGMVITIGFMIVWFITVYGINLILSNSNSTVTTSTGQVNTGGIATYAGIGIVFVFMLYWTLQVVQNTVHVTCSGLFATVYFTGTEIPGSKKIHVPVPHPTMRAAGYALTTSFGSVCYGSLLIAIIQTLRYLARMAERDAAQDGNWILCLLMCCIQCILACLEDILNYFNHYAFTQVAIYGKNYCEAAKSTWNLFVERGFEAIINDNLVDNVISLGGLCVGVLSALVAFFIVDIDKTIPQTTGYYIAYCVVGFLLGASCFYSMMSVVTSGVSATFVCIADEPATMEKLKPELFERLRATWPDISWPIQRV
ncbi:plasma-membrane choline transporter-domain-containing protein [Polychytrium aggregatum]|uniref:plasma-membrane choline transporter-domain-containing protein n=1 Tax=Polychytrium aggregatum TaxID=110093 RepID=UPI0022FF2DAC|nr:plasma-membrane choline transporter-domain-containing protein [Polychytrium aggregatum]KAI9202824.1 plasma-membrane choline transporter-domain-containing protein [Polychytrium aggregatum]